jgi:hypothetical protein
MCSIIAMPMVREVQTFPRAAIVRAFHPIGDCVPPFDAAANRLPHR